MTTTASPDAVHSLPSPSGFDAFVPKTLATPPVDRLPHHAHLNLAKGDSLRPQQAFGEAGRHVTAGRLALGGD